MADRAFAMKFCWKTGVLSAQSVRYYFIYCWGWINALFFRSRILSVILIKIFFILFFALVTSCIPLRKKFSNSACPIYPLPTHNLSFMFSKNLPCFNGSRSSTFSKVNMNFRILPLLLIIRWSLNPKNHPVEHLLCLAILSKVLWISIHWLRHTRKGVESTNLIPVQVPNRTFWWKWSMEVTPPFPILQRWLWDSLLENRPFRCLQTYSLVIMFVISEAIGMKQDKNNHNFRITHTVRFLAILMFIVFKHIFFLL